MINEKWKMSLMLAAGLSSAALANVLPVPWLIAVGAEAKALCVAHEPLVNARLNLEGTI